MKRHVASLFFACQLFNIAEAFSGCNNVSNRRLSLNHMKPQLSKRSAPGVSKLYATPEEQVEIKSKEGEAEDRSKLDAFLEKKYKSFYKLINEEMMKAIKKGSVTVFVPNDDAFAALGEKKLRQLEDPRNDEIKEKMGSYHIMPEPISAIELRTEDWTKGRPKDGSKPNTLIAGIRTLSGEVPVGRSKSGGFLGLGATEDGDIVIGPSAKIVQSFNVEGSFVHEVDSLISPQILWRYCDQLRLPGF
ncbi:fasciclin domain containing protein [Nitzschia inconspicua]|uniref:Fasciclin domain containing protein n=1 Tax=Nitzschia inconspicua TaxID=303405 RepID=A0A9K3K7I2_9STRA|nr:fasciclin domain containing protein [Nitzschia inconspicua]KAG7353178.1 fasciclin domain containing protein [Nitzschia inconspicua]